MPRRGCDHIGILTGDAERLMKFYCDLLGYRTVRDEVVDAAVMEAVFATAAACRLVKLSPADAGPEGVNIEIFCYLEGGLGERPTRASGYNHWGLRVDSREDFIADARRRGLAVTEIRRDGRPVFFISDPDGNRIEISD